jgi:catechol 2,3-dioxygenase-like lactoylglutathione lyase family enzyme
MLDHIGFTVSDLAAAKAFYVRALAPLRLSALYEVTPDQSGGEAFVGFGRDAKPFFWIGTGDRPKGGLHVALVAATRAQVDAFYEAAIAAGGRDNGGPGVRPHYHANYYGAFVLDADGNNIEAVCHAPVG